MTWKGQPKWEQCSRCETSRPAGALEVFGGKPICRDLKWCNDLVRARGGFEVDAIGLTKEQREAIEKEEAVLSARPSAPDLGGEE